MCFRVYPNSPLQQRLKNERGNSSTPESPFKWLRPKEVILPIFQFCTSVGDPWDRNTVLDIEHKQNIGTNSEICIRVMDDMETCWRSNGAGIAQPPPPHVNYTRAPVACRVMGNWQVTNQLGCAT